MKERVDNGKPQARREGLIVQHLPEEVLVYDLQRHKAHCLNQTAAEVWKYCDGKTSAAEIACLVEKQMKGEMDEAMVWYALEQLSKAQLLDGKVKQARGKAGVSRRDVVKKIGLATAVGLPLVTSIVAPTATEAATCRASGSSCGTSSQCCSGVCSGGRCA